MTAHPSVNPAAASAASNGLVLYAPTQAPVTAAPELTFNDRQVDLIKRMVAPDCTEDELTLFLEVCRTTGLNPLMKQIYAIVRGKKDENRKLTIQTGIDGYRLLAARTTLLAGIDDAIYDSESETHPVWASVTVYRLVAGQRMPFTAKARWTEYAQQFDEWQNGKRTGKKRLGDMWEKMPYLMLAKCAEALALRKAFPAELSGLYTNEEMAQADNPPMPYVEAEPEPPQRPAQAQQAPQAPQRRQQATPASPWKAMTDADVLQALNHLDIRGRAAVQAFLGTIKAEMEQVGLAWTSDQVLAYIAEHYGSGDVTADGGEETNAGDWSVTPMGANDAHDLAQIDTGMPGN